MDGRSRRGSRCQATGVHRRLHDSPAHTGEGPACGPPLPRSTHAPSLFPDLVRHPVLQTGPPRFLCIFAHNTQCKRALCCGVLCHLTQMNEIEQLGPEAFTQVRKPIPADLHGRQAFNYVQRRPSVGICALLASVSGTLRGSCGAIVPILSTAGLYPWLTSWALPPGAAGKAARESHPVHETFADRSRRWRTSPYLHQPWSRSGAATRTAAVWREGRDRSPRSAHASP
jgi:hypothetical protein